MRTRMSQTRMSQTPQCITYEGNHTRFTRSGRVRPVQHTQLYTLHTNMTPNERVKLRRCAKSYAAAIDEIEESWDLTNFFASYPNAHLETVQEYVQLAQEAEENGEPDYYLDFLAETPNVGPVTHEQLDLELAEYMLAVPDAPCNSPVSFEVSNVNDPDMEQWEQALWFQTPMLRLD